LENPALEPAKEREEKLDEESQMKSMPASEEIINLLAGAPNILEFKPSEKAKARVWELIAREKTGILTPEEKNELDHYAQVEHIMRLVKAQARRRLQSSP
jgi:hypothetical protein